MRKRQLKAGPPPKRTAKLRFGLLLAVVFLAAWLAALWRNRGETVRESYVTSELRADPVFGESSRFSRSLVTDDPSKIPEYAGADVIELNEDRPGFSEYDIRHLNGEHYCPLDQLGRCGPAFARIDASMMPAKERESLGGIRPSGWHTVKYPELIEDRYLYNRCHLIAYALTGENANARNLFTGTRYLNVSVMLPFEQEVLRALRAAKGPVLYRVTPYFKANELVARGVEMEAYSVEDCGESLCFHVFCYNVQPGISIDYATGESRAVKGDGRR